MKQANYTAQCYWQVWSRTRLSNSILGLDLIQSPDSLSISEKKKIDERVDVESLFPFFVFDKLTFGNILFEEQIHEFLKTKMAQIIMQCVYCIEEFFRVCHISDFLWNKHFQLISIYHLIVVDCIHLFSGMNWRGLLVMVVILDRSSKTTHNHISNSCDDNRNIFLISFHAIIKNFLQFTYAFWYSSDWEGMNVGSKVMQCYYI